jgi:hypothetical protein
MNLQPPKQFPMSLEEFIQSNGIDPVKKEILLSSPNVRQHTMMTENQWKQTLNQMLKQPA